MQNLIARSQHRCPRSSSQVPNYVQFEAGGVTRVPEPDADEDTVPVDNKTPVELKTEQCALKTLKTLVNACVDLWQQQEDQPVVYNGKTVYRGKEHPRSPAVQSLLKLHRVFFLLLSLSSLDFS